MLSLESELELNNEIWVHFFKDNTFLPSIADLALFSNETLFENFHSIKLARVNLLNEVDFSIASHPDYWNNAEIYFRYFPFLLFHSLYQLIILFLGGFVFAAWSWLVRLLLPFGCKAFWVGIANQVRFLFCHCKLRDIVLVDDEKTAIRSPLTPDTKVPLSFDKFLSSFVLS